MACPVTGTNCKDYTDADANFVYGYYADGFFDRRTIVPSPAGGSQLTAVATSGNDIAYAGHLFFNPTTRASLFIPAAGYRTTNGSLSGAGQMGYYWTSSANSATTAWDLHDRSTLDAYHNVVARSTGQSVRCIACVPAVSLSLNAPSNPTTIGGTASLTATSYSGAIYEWEFFDGTEWIHLATTSTNRYNVPVYRVGPNNEYKVTIMNACRATVATVIVTGVFPIGPDNPVPNVPIYAGAFWKANQTGERVIRIGVGAANLGNSGPWTATVSWLDNQWNPGTGDGIVLAHGLATPNTLYTANPGNAENYKVPGNSTMISGTVAPNGHIEFRIGLQQPYTINTENRTANPVRYAVVFITYGNGKWRRIFIRQGEAADYLMRPQDAGNGLSGVTPRPNAKKFMPYNLKHAANNIPTGTNAPPNFSTGSGVFVDYPSMLGYMFSFNVFIGTPSYNGFLFSPWAPGQLDISDWWSNTSAETCPTGYRRPTDGPINSAGTGAISVSEMRQSLWVNPPSGQTSANVVDNSSGGLYADGYYDRGIINNNSIGQNVVYYNYGAPSPPSILQIYNASAGRLFFNPVTNASIFFPAAGDIVSDSQGLIQNIGILGGYWTSTAYAINGNNRNASFLYFNSASDASSSAMRMDAARGSRISSIRCVVP